MSMTIQTSISGMSDLELLTSALKEMGKKVYKPKSGKHDFQGENIVAVTNISGNRIGISKSKKGELNLVGDSDWNIMQDKKFHQKLRQQYSVEAVKKKAAELRYSISSVDVQEDGSIKLTANSWR